MRGLSRARAAAWLFRLVFYGGSLTLIGLHFFGGPGEARPPELLRGQVAGLGSFTVEVADRKIVGWRTGTVEVRCDGISRPWTTRFAGDERKFERRAERGFVAPERFREDYGNGWTAHVRLFSSGTVATDETSARGVVRLRGVLRYMGGRPTRCDSGLRHWSASRQP